MTGLTGNRRSGGATSEERGEKKHRVREHGLLTVPGVRNLKRKKNELWVAEEGVKTLKTEELEITRSNKSAGGPLDGNKRGEHVTKGRLQGTKTKPSGSN